MADVTLADHMRQVRSRSEDLEGSRFGDLSGLVADGVVLYLEQAALEEFNTLLGAARYERGSAVRRDYRNGTRTRTVQTPYSTAQIRIPRPRTGGFVPTFLEPNHRAIDAVAGFVKRGLLDGLTRAQVERCLESTCGVHPSPGLVARVQEQLDTLAKEFKERRLDEDYEYLFLDAAWVKDIVGYKAVRVCILTAVGITRDGTKVLLGFERATRESESTWRGFLTRLISRGLQASKLRLVTSDEHKGLMNAVAEVLGEVPHQLCWAHRVRNVLDHVNKSDRKEVLEGLRSMYRAANRSAGVAAWAKFEAAWRERYPSVVQSLKDDLRYLLAFFDAPSLHYSYVRTSNPIERVFRDLRRRTLGAGAFTNKQACDRVLFSVFSLLNETWKEKNLWYKRQLQAKKNVAG